MKRHPEWLSYKSRLRDYCIDMASNESKWQGGAKALASLFEILPFELQTAVRHRLAEIDNWYEETRRDWIEIIASEVAQALVMYRHVPHGGRPLKLLPDYGNQKSLYPAVEFKLAVQLFEEKQKTGKMTGLKRLLEQEPHLPPDGESEQRIKRIVQRMMENKDIYLPPPVTNLRKRAIERVTKSKDFVTCFAL